MRPPLLLRVLPFLAYRAWFTPPALSERAVHRDAQAVAGLEPITISLPDGEEFSGSQAGDGPVVLALHGWGGRSAQMSHVVRRLADEGMRVVTVDLPGGAGGPPTDIKMVASTIEALIEALGSPSAVVAHSFAALALRLVTSNPPPTVVMMAPVLKVSDALEGFSEQARLAPWVRISLWRRLEAWDPHVFAQLTHSHPDQLGGADVLIVHDPEDGDASYASSAELAALRPRTTLMPLSGSGHNGILRDPAALETLAAFISGRSDHVTPVWGVASEA